MTTYRPNRQEVVQRGRMIKRIKRAYFAPPINYGSYEKKVDAKCIRHFVPGCRVCQRDMDRTIQNAITARESGNETGQSAEAG